MYKYRPTKLPTKRKSKQMGGRKLSLLHMHLCCCCCTRRPLTGPPHNSQSAPPPHDSRNAPPPRSSSSSSSAVFNKNFNSLYDSPAESYTLTGSCTARTLIAAAAAAAAAATTSAEEEDDDVITSSGSEPDLSAVLASRRLTRPASTGRSSSMLAEQLEEEDGSRAVGFGAVPRVSPDPYEDFKKSIEEMVAALGLRRPPAVGDGQEEEEQEQERQQQARRRLQELLLCYLALNRKNAHKYIVGAFADVLRGFSSPPTGRRGADQKNDQGRGCLH